MRKIFSDEISECYRKFIIKVKLSATRSYYLLWGTDLEDEDYLLVNKKNEILAFVSIKDLLQYTKSLSQEFKDGLRLKMWGDGYKGTKAYTTYNLTQIDLFLDSKNDDIASYNKDWAMTIVDFSNLFSDYAYQINDSDLIRLYENANLSILIDYFNVHFFWGSAHEMYMSELNKRIQNFDWNDVKKVVRNMYSKFIGKIIVMK